MRGRAAALILVLGCAGRRAGLPGVEGGVTAPTSQTDGDRGLPVDATAPAIDAAVLDGVSVDLAPMDAAGADDAAAADRTGAPDTDPIWLDPQQLCALAPQTLEPRPYPPDILHRIATYDQILLGKVTTAPTWVLRSEPFSYRAEVIAELMMYRRYPSTRPRPGETVSLAVAEQTSVAVGTRAWFFPTVTGYPDNAPVQLADRRPTWRLDAATHPDFALTASNATTYLAARPIYTATIAEPVSIVVGVATTKLVLSGHCSSPGWTAMVTVERTLCGGARGPIKVVTPPHGLAGCAGAPDEGRAPPLEVGRPALFLLRDRSATPWGDSADFSVFLENDVRPPEAWDEVARLRQAADR